MDETQFGHMKIIGNASDTKQADKKQKSANCPDVNAFAGYLDNKLADKDKEDVEKHMAQCGTCRMNLYDIKMLMDHDPQSTPEGLADNVKKNLQTTFSAPAQGRKIKI